MRSFDNGRQRALLSDCTSHDLTEQWACHELLGGSAGVTSSRETVTDQVTINLETTGEKNTQLLSFKFLWTNRLGALPGIEDLLARLAQQLVTVVSLILTELSSVISVYQIKLLLVNSNRPSGLCIAHIVERGLELMLKKKLNRVIN